MPHGRLFGDAQADCGCEPPTPAPSRWASAFSDPQWLQADLGALRWLKGLDSYGEAAFSAQFDLLVSVDGISFDAVRSNAAGFTGAADTTTLSNGRAARYVCLLSKRRATSWGNSLFELERRTCRPGVHAVR